MIFVFHLTCQYLPLPRSSSRKLNFLKNPALKDKVVAEVSAENNFFLPLKEDEKAIKMGVLKQAELSS